MKKATISLLSILASLAIGFFIGRSTADEGEIRYVRGEQTSGSVPAGNIKLIKEETPVSPILPIKSIATMPIVVPMSPVVDTAAIILEYEKRRTYSAILFDDKKLGRLELHPTIQYNQLSSIDYDFTPIQKEIIKCPTFEPFISASYSTLNYISVGGGLFYHSLGLEYKYWKSLGSQPNGSEFGLKYKF
ncbi:MAG: hypothetical protein LBN74_02350 [Prevotella sp.]|jgi:hypothetical protein|nr:hypothetical protein [Prevotella sp.]